MRLLFVMRGIEFGNFFWILKVRFLIFIVRSLRGKQTAQSKNISHMISLDFLSSTFTHRYLNAYLMD